MNSVNQNSSAFDVYSMNRGHQIEIGCDQGSYYLQLTKTEDSRRANLGLRIPMAQADLILLYKNPTETLKVDDGYYRIVVQTGQVYVLEGDSDVANLRGGRPFFGHAIRGLFDQLGLLHLLSK